MDKVYSKIQKIVYSKSIVGKPLKLPRSYTLSAINKSLKSYHKHISLTKNVQMRKRKNKMPKISFHKKSGTLYLYYYTYYYNGDMKFYQKYVKYVQKHLSFYLKKKIVKGIVIDLRKHRGGWMNPFLESLSTTILNHSSLFKFYSKKTHNRWWNIQNGKIIFSSGAYLGKSLNLPYPMKIAVLISNQTASSGEVCASIFKRNLPNVRIFGRTKSAGYLSINQSFPIDQNHTLHIPICYVQTVDKKIQKNEYLYPDVYTKNPQKRAMEWIQA